MYVCMDGCKCIYVCMYVLHRGYTYVCMYVCICMYVCMHVVCMYVCMYVHIDCNGGAVGEQCTTLMPCMYVCMYVCMQACM